MRVVLIGYRGSGKSVVGEVMACRLGLEFVDADAEIENRAGRAIAEIFADDGEAGFRRLEREVIAELAGRDAVIIAAGGGAVLDPQTRDEWNEPDTLVIWLTATPEELARRIARDQATGDRRPSLTGDGVLEEISEVLAQRADLYRGCQTLTIDTTGRTIEEVAVEAVEAANTNDRSGET